MRDIMAISAYILKIVENDPYLRLQMRGKEDFSRHQLWIFFTFQPPNFTDGLATYVLGTPKTLLSFYCCCLLTTRLKFHCYQPTLCMLPLSLDFVSPEIVILLLLIQMGSARLTTDKNEEKIGYI